MLGMLSVTCDCVNHVAIPINYAKNDYEASEDWDTLFYGSAQM